MKTKALRAGLGVIVILLMAFILGIVHPLGAGSKDGAKLKIVTKDGTILLGELLAVKDRSLLVEGGKYDSSAAIELDDIRDLAIRGKSKGLLVSGIGLLGGAAVGALIGSTTPVTEWGGSSFDGVSFTAIGAGVGAAAGAAFGFLVGSLMRQDEPLIVASVYQLEPGELLKKLRAAAKDPEYR